jgi:hypothetical protein
MTCGERDPDVTSPRAADERRGRDLESVEHGESRPGTILDRIPLVRVAALAVARSVDQHHTMRGRQGVPLRIPAPPIDEEAVRKHDRRSMAGCFDCQQSHRRIDRPDFVLIHGFGRSTSG